MSISESFSVVADPPNFDALRERVAEAAYKAASLLTDPLCKGHELFRRIALTDAAVKKIFLGIAMLGCAALGVITAAPGIALRSFASYIQKNPYIHVATGEPEKALPPNGSFTLFTWNVCCVGGGYPISDGGVLPWAFRIDGIAQRIKEKDPDVVCLNEIFDLKAGYALVDRLRGQGYAHFYFNFGARGIGSSSGLFIASKYRIDEPEFNPFPQEMLIGRTKHCAKGIFGFDLASQSKPFARIFATHLQHSEEPEFPTGEEVEARRRQMALIAEKVGRVWGRAVLATGDLNLDDAEYRSSSWKERFDPVEPRAEFTWGGDGFCAALVGKRISGPLNLDYTLVKKGSAAIQTEVIAAGFDGSVFQKNALSDHSGLLSRITPLSKLP